VKKRERERKALNKREGENLESGNREEGLLCHFASLFP